MIPPDPQASSGHGHGIPVRWHWQPHAAGDAAEPSAREWLAAQLGVAPGALALGRDVRGRPRLDAPHASHDCNWSHSGDGLLLALGKGVRVGADLERIRPRPRAQALAERFFTVQEARWLAISSETERDRDRAFVRLWCAKEAVLKAHGHGLSFGLDRLRFESLGDALQLVDCDPALGAPAAWSLREFEPAPGYLAALAWRPS
ncbi:MAG TPA: 4'-phosphopantetheinyl transferase superfamily protein [Lysobacter sp.]